MATAASKAADSYIGSLICLITKSDIRYEGFLFHLDAAESTIGLRNGIHTHSHSVFLFFDYYVVIVSL